MTTPQPAPPPAFDYVGGNAELDALLAAENEAKQAADAAKERHDALKDRVKAALTSVLYQGGAAAATPYQRYNIRVPGQPARLLSWVTSRRVVTASLKARYPEVYEECSSVTGTWKLERVK